MTVKELIEKLQELVKIYGVDENERVLMTSDGVPGYASVKEATPRELRFSTRAVVLS